MPPTKLVRVSSQLEDRFNRLPNKENWAPVGFPEFVREAVRQFLTKQEKLAKFGVSGVQEEGDQRQAGAPPGKPSRRK
jgi:hypothetical protein